MSYDIGIWILPGNAVLKRKGQMSAYEQMRVGELVEKVFGQRRLGEF